MTKRSGWQVKRISTIKVEIWDIVVFARIKMSLIAPPRKKNEKVDVYVQRHTIGCTGDREMKKESRPSTLRFGGFFSKGEQDDEIFRPDERQADAEALICLNCPLPDCKKNVCERFKEEMKKIKEQNK